MKQKIKKMIRIKNKMGLIIKSNIRPRVKELDKDDEISSVSDEVETALERKVEDILAEGI